MLIMIYGAHITQGWRHREQVSKSMGLKNHCHTMKKAWHRRLPSLLTIAKNKSILVQYFLFLVTKLFILLLTKCSVATCTEKHQKSLMIAAVAGNVKQFLKFTEQKTIPHPWHRDHIHRISEPRIHYSAVIICIFPKDDCNFMKSNKQVILL